MNIFALHRGEGSNKETSSLALASINYPDKYKLKYFDKPSEVDKDMIPMGTIKWVESVLGKTVKPDYYPAWTKPLYGRKIWYANAWPMEANIFIKPSDKHKRYKARITTGGYKGKKKGPHVCSEFVNFVQEWRIYVSNGRVLYNAWYSEYEKPEVEISDKFLNYFSSLVPIEYCGAVDVGLTNNNEMLLVECNAPYSCGWYGPLDKGDIYAEWLISGMKYIKESLNVVQN